MVVVLSDKKQKTAHFMERQFDVYNDYEKIFTYFT